jgi:hypothetical protein
MGDMRRVLVHDGRPLTVPKWFREVRVVAGATEEVPLPPDGD